MPKNWQEINTEFTPELQKKWEEKGFSYEQTKEWADALVDKFEVSYYDFCAWLRDEKELTAEGLEELKYYYKDYKLWEEYFKNQSESEVEEEENAEEKKSDDEESFAHQLLKETKEAAKHTKLKELIQQAKNKEIPWSCEITLDSFWLKVKNKNLQHVLPENWDKIRHTYPNWNRHAVGHVVGASNDLIEQIEKSNKLIDKDSNKFVSEGILEKFKKYTNLEEELTISRWGKKKKIKDINLDDKIYSRWSTISDRLKDGQKIFGRGGDSSAYQSEDAFRFFQSIIGNESNHTIRYQPDQTFKLEEWKHDDEKNLTWNMQFASKDLKKVTGGLLECAKELKDLIKDDTAAQKWLDKKYPNKKERENVIELELAAKGASNKLDLSDFINLEKLDCSLNYLTSLNLTNCKKLTELKCRKNRLTSLNLSQNKELRLLDASGNRITSLTFSQPPKLEFLNVGSSHIGLEYLPLSLKSIEHSGKSIKNELFLYGNNLALWQEAHPELMTKIGKDLVTNPYDNNSLQIVITTPKYLRKELKNNQKLNYDLGNLDYTEFVLRDSRPFFWETQSETKPLESTELPLRLYNLKDEKVETTEGRDNIKHYLALSYMWGQDWENKKKTYGRNYQTDLTKLGRKALNKVLQAAPHTGINHIWIDNFCINQEDSEEKGQEVRNQKQYYNNASATLIAIDGKIGEVGKKNKLEFAKHIIKQIVTSSWFTRAWTFQEGLLSKQTIFMFDDGLVDGRILAQVWVGTQDMNSSNIPLNRSVLATPLGWSYGAKREQTTNLGLVQSLHAVAHRKQTVPLDGIYAILGLLPYGEKVKTKYKNKVCQHSEEEQKDTKICQHSEEDKEWPKYTVSELEQTLLEVMKLAIDSGYPQEVLTWLGERRNIPELWWIPIVGKNGSTNMEGFAEIKPRPGDLKITAQGVELVGTYDYTKESVTFVLNDGKVLDIQIPTKEYSRSPIRIKEEKEKSRILYYFYHKDLYTSSKKPIFVDMVNKKVIVGKQAVQEYQAQIEVFNPPKK